MRVLIFVFAVILVILSFGLAFRYNQLAVDAQKKLNSERYLKMDAEDKLQQAESKVNSLGGELDRVKKKLALLEKNLEQKDFVIEDLRTRLDNTAKIKESLDRQIKDLQAYVGVK